MEDLGTLERAIITKTKTVLIGNGKQDEAVKKRIGDLKELIKSKTGTKWEWDIPRLEQRIYKLNAAVARIFIGGSSDAEVEDKRLRYEDAINALTGACMEGMVPGGGACYTYMTRYADEARAIFDTKEEAIAVDVLVEAMSEPIKQIARNAGEFGEMVFEKAKGQPWGYGFNAATLDYENLTEAGVSDPASVNTWALENAASVAGSLLTTEALVYQTEMPEDDEVGYTPEVEAGIGKEAAERAW